MLTKQEMKNRARLLRKKITPAENSLWYLLRDRRLNGFKFRRQYVVGAYIVDFVCLNKKIVIEVDGEQHADNVTYDERRTAYLNARGFSVLRYSNNDVLYEIEVVVEDILNRLIPDD